MLINNSFSNSDLFINSAWKYRRFPSMSITTKILRHVVPWRNALSYSTSSDQTRNQLCALLRETAQPVSVVTSIMPSSISGTADKGKPRYHGATLSSFTSIAMDPYPLVAFSLRIPSRMAQSLKFAHPHMPSQMVINLLSAPQSSTAVQFSRPDIYPEPFSTILYSLSEDGLPVLRGSLGALSCKLVSTPLPLHDLEYLENKGGRVGNTLARSLAKSASELFIARVMRVEKISPQEEEVVDGSRTLPLLYHRRGYTSCHTTHHDHSEFNP
jgi:flavin reductase (DIM6/NTAB) family NADH-FMN oxidoreductase RutF